MGGVALLLELIDVIADAASRGLSWSDLIDVIADAASHVQIMARFSFDRRYRRCGLSWSDLIDVIADAASRGLSWSDWIDVIAGGWLEVSTPIAHAALRD